MGINGAQIPNFWETAQPFSIVTSGYQINLDVTEFTVTGSVIYLATNAIKTINILAGAVDGTKLAATSVGPTHINFDAYDVPYLTGDIGTALDLCVYTDGTRPLTANWEIGSNVIENSGTPVNDTDVPNKVYVDGAVAVGNYWRSPTLLTQLQLYWIRASASLYLNVNPNPGDQLTVHGVTFTFVAGAETAPAEITIQGTVTATATRAQIRMSACTTLTLDGNAFNVDFSVTDFNQYIIVTVLLEDPPNTPSDGNNKSISSAATAIKVANTFRGGSLFDWENTGTSAYVLDQAKIYTYTHGSGWAAIT